VILYILNTDSVNFSEHSINTGTLVKTHILTFQTFLGTPSSIGSKVSMENLRINVIQNISMMTQNFVH